MTPLLSEEGARGWCYRVARKRLNRTTSWRALPTAARLCLPVPATRVAQRQNVKQPRFYRLP